jgi:predicted CXXCH cytochrome family protein
MAASAAGGTDAKGAEMNARRWWWLVAVAVAAVLASTGAAAAEIDCARCHRGLSKQKVVHAAMQMGCATCHGAVDAAVVPHRITGKVAKGLTAEQGELCLTCHDKAKFEKKVVHAPLGMGCTACHDPHASANEKLLTAVVPALCTECHAKDDFTGKVVHAPVGGGMCMACHDPHSADRSSLLPTQVTAMCLECHGDIKKKPHVVAGFGGSGHPLGDEKRPAPVADSLRPGKAFSCVSCHEPHRSNFRRLSRIDPGSGMGMCQKCHAK